MNIVVVGGGSKVALHFTKLATAAAHTVHSLVRNDSHDDAIRSAGGKPMRFSLEDDTSSAFATHLRTLQADAVVFSAGAGGKGGLERTRKVDYEGALKVFDGMEEAGVSRILLVSATDLRDRSQPPPDWYSEADVQMSDRMWGAIGTYMQAKLDADLSLLSRPALSPIILRPGGLTDAPASRTVLLGEKVHLGQVARADVAGVALRLLESAAVKGGTVLNLMGESEGQPKGESWEAAVERVVGEQQ